MDQQIQQAIDACRPGSDDIRLPDMLHLADAIGKDDAVRKCYDRVQRQDAEIMEAMADVPAPEGLVDRMLSVVEKADAESQASKAQLDKAQLDKAGACTALPHQRKAPRWRIPRRLWTVGAISATILLALGLWILPRKTIGPAFLVEEAPKWLARAEKEFVQGDKKIVHDPAEQAADRPPTSLLKNRPRQWMRISIQGLDRRAVAYDWQTSIGTSAVLFVIQAGGNVQVDGLSSPKTPLRGASKGVTIGAWEADGMLYVLVVRGGQERYRTLFRHLSVA